MNWKFALFVVASAVLGVFAEPTLNIRPVGSSIEISWPDSLVGFTLQETASLSDPAWRPSAQTSIQSGGSNVVVVQAIGSEKYFRLAAAAGLVINEVDYDQPSIDTMEFVEIYNPTDSIVSLSGVALALVNGSTAQLEYRRVDLSSAGVLSPGQYLVVCNSSVTPNLLPGTSVISLGSGNDYIQNGAPDGIALIHVPTSTIIDALSYEGSITAATINGFPGPQNLVEGIPFTTADIATGNASLSRLPNGVDTDNASSDWRLTPTPTPGAANQ